MAGALRRQRALFAAGGTGEYFSLAPAEYADVDPHRGGHLRRQSAHPGRRGRSHPHGDRLCAGKPKRLGAKGILLMPHYLTEASADGIAEHVEQVCKSLKIGVIVYNRANSRLGPDHLRRVADRCPNLIGFKDGVGDIENMVRVRRAMGDRFAYLGGLPTAEVYAAAYKALGVPVYSSAVFNFIPKTAMQFYPRHRGGRPRRRSALLRRILPAVSGHPQPARRLCGQYRPGAGARLVGAARGPVRASADGSDGRRKRQAGRADPRAGIAVRRGHGARDTRQHTRIIAACCGSSATWPSTARSWSPSPWATASADARRHDLGQGQGRAGFARRLLRQGHVFQSQARAEAGRFIAGLRHQGAP